jgi:predicted acylesterase/phospholipase RssA
MQYISTEKRIYMNDDSLKPCDLVMKGGITSGIIYPPAVLELKNKYTFRSIGGTSAGAIAAVGTAAAEYNRDNGGFEHLEGVSKWLSEDNNLRNLFQANDKTQPLMDILLALLEPSPTADTPADTQSTAGVQAPLVLRVAKMLAPHLSGTLLNIAASLIRTWSPVYTAYKVGGTRGMRLGIIAGIILGIILALVITGIVAVVAPGIGIASIWILLSAIIVFSTTLAIMDGWIGLWFGRILGVIGDIGDLAENRLYESFYGVCTGHKGAPSASAQASTSNNSQSASNTGNEQPALTDWLCDVIDQMAGLEGVDRPLTFGKLKTKQIDLQTVTSNLSHNQPYILPDDLHNFLFSVDDMSQLFPPYIVTHLIKHAPQPGQTDTSAFVVPPETLPNGYYFFPQADDLPVILAARLSLSFPVLLSAIPLYTVSTQAAAKYWEEKNITILDKDRDLQKNWFSDGGICSNFPIHFFDAWLPTRPTFGINLMAVRNDANTSALEAHNAQPRSSAAQAKEDNLDVYLPRAEEQLDVEWQGLTGIVPFLQAVYGISQGYRDNMQCVLPSYRERVMQIRLNDREGGLNLTMPQSVIKGVVSKGTEAGQKFLDRTEFDFDQHWWVRFLVLMAQLEKNIAHLHKVLGDPTTLSIDERLQREVASAESSTTRYPYYRDEDWRIRAMPRIDALCDLIATWQQINDGEKVSAFFGQDAPQPDPALRVTPRI